MAKFSVRKPLTIFAAALAIIILGVVAFRKMTPDLLPNMDFPYVVIMTAYPGASPETVEEEVTKPMEQSMATLEHIKTVSSTSSENYSVVVLEFEESVNMDTVGVDIQQNITALSGQWSDSVGTPYVIKINPSLLPVEVAAVSMEGMDNIELSDFVDDALLPRLDGVTGVARISTIGSISRQVHVVIDQDKIDAVNRRMADAVNEKMDDAAAELEDTRAELEEARAELESAQEQLESGKSALVSQTASAEAALSQQTIAALEGRMELQQQLVTVQETRTQLETTLSIIRPIMESIQELEARERELSARIAALENAGAALEAADAALQEAAAESVISSWEEPAADGTESEPAADGAAEEPVFFDGAAEIDTEDEPASETGEAQADTSGELAPQEEETLPDGSVPVSELPARAAGSAVLDSLDLPDAGDIADLLDLGDSQAYLAALEAVTEAEAALTALGTDRYTYTMELAAAQAELSAVQAELSAIDATLASLDMSRDKLPETVEQMESGLEQADEGAELLQNTLDQLDAGTMQIGEATGLLSQGKSEGLLQLAGAAAMMSTNSAALESALSQVDSGLESLEDSRANALASADITDRISMSLVSSILTAQNFTMPAGYIAQDGVNYMVSVGDLITETEELENLLIFDTGEDAIGPVYLSDVAEIFVTDNSADTYAKLDGEQGLILSFEKQSNAATADVTNNLGARFSELEDQYPGLKFVPLMDQGEYIYMIVDSILESLLAGAVFAILVLFLFLRDLRPTFITLVSIPISVVFAVVLMYFTGVSMNMISLSGLAVSVGMLVDNSIVVIENIYRLRSRGATAVQAAVAGTRQVAGAITASTLTTVCVFLPIVFVQGITKQLFTDLALTLGYSLMASLIVALTLVPAMSRGMLKNPRLSDRKGVEGRFYRGYRKLIAWALRRKWIVLPLALILLAVSARLALARGFSFMPEMDANTVTVTIAMPEDADRETAAAVADEALARIQTVNRVETVGAMMGGSSLLGAGSGTDVTAYVTLEEGASGAEAGRQIQALCEDLDCEIDYDSTLIDTSYLTGKGISLYVYSNDMDDLQSAAQTIADALAGLEGVSAADPGLEDAAPAIHIEVDKNAAMEKGYTVAQLYMEISAALSDTTTAMTMDIDDVTADVLVQSGDMLNRRQLAALPFDYTDADGNSMTFRLRDVAELKDTMSLTSIRREDQRRYLGVTASVAEGYNVTLVTAEAERALGSLELPAGVTYEFDGENESILEAVGQLGLMLLLGVLLVYFIMVAQFQSLKSPFIVMFTIPLAFTGGFLALLICGMEVSVVSLIGFVMLTGIIVNNGIVLVDYVNQLRAGGMERREALIEAGVTRLRPILMTSLTTILGLFIMALGRDVGTALMQPVAVVCIGGLLYATLMTLFVIPCIYDMVNKKEITAVTEEDMEFHER